MESKLCKIREIYRTIQLFEQDFEKEYQISLNEGMLLCILAKAGTASSGYLANELGLTCSNTSKVIKSVEKKGLIARELGQQDRRQMYFSLSPGGEQLLGKIKCSGLEMPEIFLTGE